MYVEFVRLLNELRQGFITPLAIESFRALSRPIVSSDSDLPPTELFPMRYEVERANSTRLAALQSPPVSYDARNHARQHGLALIRRCGHDCARACRTQKGRTGDAHQE